MAAPSWRPWPPGAAAMEGVEGAEDARMEPGNAPPLPEVPRELPPAVRRAVLRRGDAEDSLPPPFVDAERALPPMMAEARELLRKGMAQKAMQVVLKALHCVGGKDAVASALSDAKARFWTGLEGASPSGTMDVDAGSSKRKRDDMNDLVAELRSLLKSCGINAPSPAPPLTKRPRGSLQRVGDGGVPPEPGTYVCEACGQVIAVDRRPMHERLWCPALGNDVDADADAVLAGNANW